MNPYAYPSQPLPEIILDMREAYLVMEGQLVLVLV